jgi:hypothetical protein
MPVAKQYRMGRADEGLNYYFLTKGGLAILSQQLTGDSEM